MSLLFSPSYAAFVLMYIGLVITCVLVWKFDALNIVLKLAITGLTCIYTLSLFGIMIV